MVAAAVLLDAVGVLELLDVPDEVELLVLLLLVLPVLAVPELVVDVVVPLWATVEL